jgi:hypothetical protein
MYYASFMLFVLSLASSKISMVLFQARLTANLRQRRLFRGCAIFISIWAVGSFLALALQCNLSRPWLIVGHHCSGAVCLYWYHCFCAMGNRQLTRCDLPATSMDNHQCFRHRNRNCDRVSGLLPCVEFANAQRTKMDGRLCLWYRLM